MSAALEVVLGLPQRGQSIQTYIHHETLKGIKVSRLRVMGNILGFTPEQMALQCGVSRSTFHRVIKLHGHRLDAAKSDQLVRHAELYDKAVEALDDPESAREWLRTPQVGLGGEIPLNMAKTTTGYREVEKLLTRIDYGVYA